MPVYSIIILKTMDLIQKKRGRPLGSKNILAINHKAESVFNDLFKTFNEDLTKVTPRERIAACVSLAGYLLTTNQTNQKL